MLLLYIFYYLYKNFLNFQLFYFFTYFIRNEKHPPLKPMLWVLYFWVCTWKRKSLYILSCGFHIITSCQYLPLAGSAALLSSTNTFVFCSTRPFYQHREILDLYVAEYHLVWHVYDLNAEHGWKTSKEINIVFRNILTRVMSASFAATRHVAKSGGSMGSGPFPENY